MPWEAILTTRALDFGVSFTLVLLYLWSIHTGRLHTRGEWNEMMADKKRLQDIIDRSQLRTELKLEEMEKDIWAKKLEERE